MSVTRRNFIQGVAGASGSSLAAAGTSAGAAESTASGRKRRTIYFNDARHYYLFVFEPPMTMQDAWRPVDEVAGTAVDTFIYGVELDFAAAPGGMPLCLRPEDVAEYTPVLTEYVRRISSMVRGSTVRGSKVRGRQGRAGQVGSRGGWHLRLVHALAPGRPAKAHPCRAGRSWPSLWPRCR